jgi:hypothetical protein
LAVSEIAPDTGWLAVTVTLAVVLGMLPALAVIVADPAATPVTGTETVVAPVPKVTVAGTVATLVLLELRLTASPAAAGADKVRVRFCVAVPEIVRPPEKLIVVGVTVPPPVTCTVALAVG